MRNGKLISFTLQRSPISLSRIKSSWTKDGREFQRYKLKFSNSEAARAQLFTQLKDHNDKIEKLLTTADRDAELKQQRVSRTRTADAASGLCSFWVHAARLFKALASAWNCACREQHCARLLLQHRTTKASEFEVLFATPVSERWEVHKTRIMEGGEETELASREVLTRLDKLPVHQPGHRKEHPLKSAMRSKNQATYVELLR
ncbi:hypothetical protein IMZ48_40470 [Candidatus Bathyarchaeota archaeon]|nr:hypothetical protein [Candidatus Bathyarchaeota archaeon]